METATRGTTSWTYEYDPLNALTDETLAVDGLSFATGYTRDGNGFVTHQTTPGGRSISYLPDGFGRPTRVGTGGVGYASGATYHVSGGLLALTYGNGRQLDIDYDDRHLVSDMSVTGGGTLLDFHYEYDDGARITEIDDNAVSGQNRAFGYDGLNRLISASGPWGAGTFSYDLLGNLHGQTLGSRTVEVDYNSLNRVSRVRDSNTGNVWRNYTHDNRGSVTSNGQLNWVYDRSEQPVSMSGSDSGSFVYDAHRRRVRQDINGETIYSVYTSSGAMVYRHNATTGEATDYLRLGGRTIARLATSGGATTVTYTHADHLGSPAAATNAAGALLWREDYTPFGETRQAPAANADGESFTGHITDSDTGVVYMQARYYDPAIGRFLSNDPVGFASGGVGYFNRYAYVGNDPVNVTDPTGMAMSFALGGDCSSDPTCSTIVGSGGGGREKQAGGGSWVPGSAHSTGSTADRVYSGVQFDQDLVTAIMLGLTTFEMGDDAFGQIASLGVALGRDVQAKHNGGNQSVLDVSVGGWVSENNSSGGFTRSGYFDIGNGMMLATSSGGTRGQTGMTAGNVAGQAQTRVLGIMSAGRRQLANGRYQVFFSDGRYRALARESRVPIIVFVPPRAATGTGRSVTGGAHVYYPY